MNSPLADPNILYDQEHCLLNKVLTGEELKVYQLIYFFQKERYLVKQNQAQYLNPEKVAMAKNWNNLLEQTLESNTCCKKH